MNGLKWSRLFLPLGGIIALVLLGAVGMRFVQFERASYTLPRLFIQLERSIGYDGFIHNFKNLVLRPQEDGYLDAALQDYAVAESTLKEISVRVRAFGVKADLEPIQNTLRAYRDMLQIVKGSQKQQLTISQVDSRVRISDEEAAAQIRDFEKQIMAVMVRRRIILYTVVTLGLVAVIAGTLLVTYVQSRRLRQAEEDKQKLEEQERYLLQAERIAGLGRWKTDRHGGMIWSEAMGKICGIPPEEFPTRLEGVWSFVPVEDQPKLRLASEQAVQSRGQFSCLHRIQRPDGSMVNVVDSGEVVLDADGRVIGFVGTLQDVSRLVDMENELRQSQKMEAIGNLAGGMAHDFNNILAVVLGNLDLLEETGVSPEQADYIANAIDATQRGGDLTRNILGFARRSQLAPNQLKGNDVVRDVMTWSSRLLPATINIETSLLANLWAFTADEGLAKNALLNLILNARDAMPDGGQLTIETANIRIDDEYIAERSEELLPGRYVMIAVSDTGTGIEKDKLAQVFEPFFSTKPMGQGTGLGLSMVLGFMKQSGGTVRIYSEVGVGTSVKLYFKAETGRAARPSPDRPGQDLSHIHGKRILLVEDNAKLLTAQEDMLTGVGFDVTIATSGDEAMATWLQNRDFDIVATDIVMPGKLQGTHLAKAIRAKDPSVPFIFMSGYANEATVHGNGLLPEDIRLMKPVGRNTLLTAITKSLADRA